MFVNLDMTTLTVNIIDDDDLPVLQEILTRFGLAYKVDTNNGFDFSDEEIASILKTKQDFLVGKTTARNWNDVEDDLNSAYN